MFVELLRQNRRMTARVFQCGRGPEDVRSSHRLAALCTAFAFAVALLCAQAAGPASADEATVLSNVLLLEQLIDVDTTQTITHQAVCSSVPIVDGSGRVVGISRPCVHGVEIDPLAKPFVVTPTSNVLAALAVNALVRVAFHRRGKRLLRLGVELYPAVVFANVATGYTIAHFVPAAPLRPTPHLSFRVRL
jgi:hypothetical protein